MKDRTTRTTSINFECWEGYETADFLAPFAINAGTTVNARTLLSDADTAESIASGANTECHVLNINNAWVRDYLYPRGYIRALPEDRFAHSASNLLPELDTVLGGWNRSASGELIGIYQRFGAFNLVVNSRKIDQQSAEDQAFHLTDDDVFNNRFGILSYVDFNLFHLCIGADVNPFAALTPPQLQKLEDLADRWQRRANVISDDHMTMNHALINGDIDFYISGGVYTSAVARRDGHSHIMAITPQRGPIDGKGGIAFAEITSIIERPDTSVACEDFLDWLLLPETATSIAMTERTCNPVAQMGDPTVMQAFTREQLDWIQWDELSETMARCEPYALMPDHKAVQSIWLAALQRRDH